MVPAAQPQAELKASARRIGLDLTSPAAESGMEAAVAAGNRAAAAAGAIAAAAVLDQAPAAAAELIVHSVHPTDDEMQDDEENNDEHVTAATLAMLASACKQMDSDETDVNGRYSNSHQHHAAGHATSAVDSWQHSQPAKRSNSSPGLQGRHNKQQRRSGSGNVANDSSPSPSSSPPLANAAAAAAAAAAAGLHKLSSASAGEFEAAMGAYRSLAAAGDDDMGGAAAAHTHSLLGSQHRGLQGSGGSTVAAAAGGGTGKNTPSQIMAQLVECGVLPSCAPDTHCFVKCGLVQGVFSLASGSILCLCDECSDNGSGEPCWFAPAAFERHGGMAASKKWRGSIQVKGLSSRKTLGQWLDERGVTAKPRLTLADQVQQQQPLAPTRTRAGGGRDGGAAGAAAAAVPAVRSASGTQGDLAAAAANAARFTNLSKALAAVGSGRARSGGHEQTVGGGGASLLRHGSTGIDVDVLQLTLGNPAAAAVAAAAGLPDMTRQAASQRPAVALATADYAASSSKQVFPDSRLNRLLAEVAAAPTAAIGQQDLPGQQQQQQFAGLLQQRPGSLLQQQLQAHLLMQQQQQQQQQQQRPAVAAPADVPADPMALLMQVMLVGDKAAAADGLVPGAGGAQPVKQEQGHTAGASPAAPGPVQQQQQPASTGEAAAAGAGGSAAASKRSLKQLLSLATSIAATNPAAASALLMEALQQQLQGQPASCQKAASNTAAAVTAAGDMMDSSSQGRGPQRRSKHTSAAAAFAAIAAAAAAAAATAAAVDEEDEEAGEQQSQQQPDCVGSGDSIRLPGQHHQQQAAATGMIHAPAGKALGVPDVVARGIASVLKDMNPSLAAQLLPTLLQHYQQQQAPASPQKQQHRPTQQAQVAQVHAGGARGEVGQANAGDAQQGAAQQSVEQLTGGALLAALIHAAQGAGGGRAAGAGAAGRP